MTQQRPRYEAACRPAEYRLPYARPEAAPPGDMLGVAALRVGDELAASALELRRALSGSEQEATDLIDPRGPISKDVLLLLRLEGRSTLARLGQGVRCDGGDSPGPIGARAAYRYLRALAVAGLVVIGADTRGRIAGWLR